MKDKRLDALLATLWNHNMQLRLDCWFYSTYAGHTSCKMIDEAKHFHTNCEGDIRKCEREE